MSAERTLKLVPASSVKTELVEWLMEAWLPRRSLTLIAGREGVGKSTITVDVAARGTNGELDNGKPLNVLYLNTEDSRSMTVKPRLEAAGANLDLVHFLDVTHEGREGALSLPGDVDALSDLIEAEHIGLVVLDAAKSAMSSTINDHRDDDVRRFLEPLARIADRHDCVFLAIVHFGKRISNDSGALILGSIAWSQVARSVLSVAKDDDTGNLIVSNTKGNLASRERCEECAIESAEVSLHDGGTTSVARVKWLGESTRSARDLLGEHAGGDDERGEIESVVLDYLEAHGGSAPAGEVLKATRAAGLTDNAVKKSRKKIGVRTERQGFGPGASWVWAIDSPIGAIGARVRARESMESMEPSTESMGADEPEDFTCEPGVKLPVSDTQAHAEVLRTLTTTEAMAPFTIAGSFTKKRRAELCLNVEAVLRDLVADGYAVEDERGRFLKTERGAIA